METDSSFSGTSACFDTEYFYPRERSYTWPANLTSLSSSVESPEPLHPVHHDVSPLSVEPDSTGDFNSPGGTPEGSTASAESPKESGTGNGNQRKTWTRTNPWGSQSYADLISLAISGSAKKRMTLAQIYDWIIQNVEYFRNRADNVSSAGWKNSIRHNLSLHSRFVRVVNEGTSRSSWWMLNADVRPARYGRDRAKTIDGTLQTPRCLYKRKRQGNDFDSTFLGHDWRSSSNGAFFRLDEARPSTQYTPPRLVANGPAARLLDRGSRHDGGAEFGGHSGQFRGTVDARSQGTGNASLQGTGNVCLQGTGNACFQGTGNTCLQGTGNARFDEESMASPIQHHGRDMAAGCSRGMEQLRLGMNKREEVSDCYPNAACCREGTTRSFSGRFGSSAPGSYVPTTAINVYSCNGKESVASCYNQQRENNGSFGLNTMQTAVPGSACNANQPGLMPGEYNGVCGATNFKHQANVYQSSYAALRSGCCDKMRGWSCNGQGVVAEQKQGKIFDERMNALNGEKDLKSIVPVSLQLHQIDGRCNGHANSNNNLRFGIAISSPEARFNYNGESCMRDSTNGMQIPEKKRPMCGSSAYIDAECYNTPGNWNGCNLGLLPQQKINKQADTSCMYIPSSCDNESNVPVSSSESSATNSYFHDLAEFHFGLDAFASDQDGHEIWAEKAQESTQMFEEQFDFSCSPCSFLQL